MELACLSFHPKPPVSMSTEPQVDLSIMLQPPPGERDKKPLERRIEGVPHSIAAEIVQDFVDQDLESETGRYQMYRIGEGDDQRLIALDFGEVSGLLVG